MKLSTDKREGVINTKEKDGEFVNAQDSDVARAMKIKHGDNPLKYMDISEKVLCQKRKLIVF